MLTFVVRGSSHSCAEYCSTAGTIMFATVMHPRIGNTTVFAGTSAGSYPAALFAFERYSGDEIIELAIAACKRIGIQKSWLPGHLAGLKLPIFDNAAMSRLVQDIFGGLTMGDFTQKVIMPAVLADTDSELEGSGSTSKRLLWMCGRCLGIRSTFWHH